MSSPQRSVSSSKPVEITGVFNRERWRPSDCESGNEFVVAGLKDGTTLIGHAPMGDLIPELTYRFFGHWEDDERSGGKQFRFTQYAKSEPHSRYGLVKYLQQHCQGIGPGISGLLHDALGPDAVKILRTDPEAAVAVVNARTRRTMLRPEVARAASDILRRIGDREDTRIELVNLLHGRQFPRGLIDQIIGKWGVRALDRLKRDPFSLLVEGFPGAGFARCDRLYMDLGLPPGRLKRQMLCVWHALREDTNGHTWLPMQQVIRLLARAISGAQLQPQRAIQLGLRSRWLSARKDATGVWIADGKKAGNEYELAARVRFVMDESEMLPRYTESLEGECDYTDSYVVADEAVELTPMQRHQLARIGRETGICQFCGRRLVSRTSVTLGYGPVCAERHGLPYSDDDDDEDDISGGHDDHHGQHKESTHETALA